MKKFLLAAVFLFSLSACKKDSPYAELEGKWSGTYSGTEDNGSWQVTIDDEGQMSGSAVSDSLPDFPLAVNGSVSEAGAFQASSNSFGLELEFTGELKGNTASGEWQNITYNFSGTWEGSKN